MNIALLLGYIIAGILSIGFIGGWLIYDRSLRWTFFISFIFYASAIYALFTKDWLNLGVFGTCFFMIVNLYFYDLYYTNKATRGGRR